MGVLVQVEVISTTMGCSIAYLWSLFSVIVHFGKPLSQRKVKTSSKGQSHRVDKSVSVDAQKIPIKIGPCSLMCYFGSAPVYVIVYCRSTRNCGNASREILYRRMKTGFKYGKFGKFVS